MCYFAEQTGCDHASQTSSRFAAITTLGRAKQARNLTEESITIE